MKIANPASYGCSDFIYDLLKRFHRSHPFGKSGHSEVDRDGTKRNIGGGKGNRKGTPQGGVISPLLANLSLPREVMW